MSDIVTPPKLEVITTKIFLTPGKTYEVLIPGYDPRPNYKYLDGGEERMHQLKACAVQPWRTRGVFFTYRRVHPPYYEDLIKLDDSNGPHEQIDCAGGYDILIHVTDCYYPRDVQVAPEWVLNPDTEEVN